jgi:hypothetical protein
MSLLRPEFRGFLADTFFGAEERLSALPLVTSPDGEKSLALPFLSD